MTTKTTQKPTEVKRLRAALAMTNKQLCSDHLAGWDDDDYRQLLARHGASEVGGKFSATTMTVAQMKDVLKTLKKQNGGDNAMVDWRAPRINKCKQLWRQLSELGAINDPSEKAMATFLQRSIKGLTKLQWATSLQLNQCVEKLKQMHAQRVAKNTAAKLKQG